MNNRRVPRLRPTGAAESTTIAPAPTPSIPSGARPLRLWPVWIILGVATLLLSAIWLGDSPGRQRQVIATASTATLTALLLLLWLLLLSRMRWKMRLATTAFFAAGLALAAATLRIQGVSGDLVPILGWRWQAPGDEADAPPPAAMPGDARAAGPAGPPPTAPPVGTVAAAETSAGAPAPPHADVVPAIALPHRDYPQFLGPDRNGVVTGADLARDWASRPPREVWRREIGKGWSAFAVAGEIAVTQEQRGRKEVVTALRLATGEPIWSHAYEAQFRDLMAGEGPRATPTIADGRVYALGSTGILSCLDLATGERIWGHNIEKDARAEEPAYGFASSPLVVDDLVVVSAGGRQGKSLVAYRKSTGELAWGGGDNAAGYSSPIVATLAGVRQILIFNASALVAHDPADGRVLWEHPWPRTCEKVSQPVPLSGDRVFLSAGYGVGCKLFQVSSDGGALSASLVWETPRLKAKFTDVVHRDGHMYGLDDGVLVCLRLADGERAWRGTRYGHGQVLLADDLLLVQAEDGEVALVDATPDAFRELARLPALHGKTWNHPALATPYLLVRNDREAACYELPVSGTGAVPSSAAGAASR